MACTASGALPAISSAHARVVASRSSSATTRLTSPRRSDSAASRSRPRNPISHALAQPTSRGRYQVPPDSGTTPRLAKPGQQPGRRGHEPEVAPEGEVEAVAGGGAVDGGDHRRVHLLEHDGGQVAGVAETPAAPTAATADAGAGGGVLEVEPEQKPLPAPVTITHRTSRTARRR